jgi:formylglycine-generating enzyme required for sulfatase activity
VEFEKFLKGTKYKPVDATKFPEGIGRRESSLQAQEDYPVVYVEFMEDAKAYARWVDKTTANRKIGVGK